ncbi:hypothetical protein EDD86DRAFT_108975 [Gorgonomyces haynaldii]|nr:hypothetical protein EDD86DRAFT_108975 [Gorgonomyces haynaldii]
MEYMEMENLWNKCSICFDNKHDFYFKHCKDQFCRQCFSRYVSETVKNSWGMTVQDICCPVCRDKLDTSEWQKYVSLDIAQAYDHLNRPYQQIITECCECHTSCVVSQDPVTEPQQRMR